MNRPKYEADNAGKTGLPPIKASVPETVFSG